MFVDGFGRGLYALHQIGRIDAPHAALLHDDFAVYDPRITVAGQRQYIVVVGVFQIHFRIRDKAVAEAFFKDAIPLSQVELPCPTL